MRSGLLARANTLTIAVVLGAAPLACTQSRATQAPTLEAPERISDLDALRQALSSYALLANDDPARIQRRDQIGVWLKQRSLDALDRDDSPAAMDALEQLLWLYRPADLRAGVPDPQLAEIGARLYANAGREGMEIQAMLALAVQAQFGDGASQQSATREYDLLVEWLSRGEAFAQEASQVLELEQVLEEVAAVLPTPWIVSRLEGIYRGSQSGKRIGNGSDTPFTLGIVRERDRYTHYRIARLRLRADDVQGAVDALAERPDEASTQGLMGVLELVARGDTSKKGEAFALAESVFDLSERDGDLPTRVQTQTWAIVENLARRGLVAMPGHARSKLALARAFRFYGWTPASLLLHRGLLDEMAADHDVWSSTAALELDEMAWLVAHDLERASKELERAEAFYAAYGKRWRSRRVEPGLDRLHYIMAAGHYDSGDVGVAESLLAKAIAQRPTPEATSLLGTIQLRRGDYVQAKSTYQSLLGLGFEDQYSRTRWEIEARSRLGEAELDAGDPAAALGHLQIALNEINLVLSLPGLSPRARSPWLVDRSSVFFHLGDIERSMADVRDAISATPDESRVYSEPMLLFVSYGHLEQARAVWRSAVAHPELPKDLQLYFTLWLLDLSARSSGLADDDALAWTRAYRGDRWTEQLARHALGELSYEDLRQQAGNSGERAEADFYEALAQTRAGQVDAGRSLLKKVIESGRVNFHEYELAKRYLAWQEIPKTARYPATRLVNNESATSSATTTETEIGTQRQ